MPDKKPPTPAQIAHRQKFAEQSRARAAERRAKKEAELGQDNTVNAPHVPALEPLPDLAPDGEPTVTISQAEFLDIQRQVLELKQMFSQPPTQPNTIGMKGGSLIGSFEKYDLTPTNYPDPRDRLSQERRLDRFAFDINYELFWDIGISSYENIEGVRVKEPKFTLALGRKLYDEESGERRLNKDGDPMGYIICRLIMHEDPEAALAIAQEQGIDIDETNEKAFLNEMRYLRMKDWLIECFYPAPKKNTGAVKEMAIGGKIVETYAITSENSEKIPFDKIKDNKL